MSDPAPAIVSAVPHLLARPADAHKGTFGKVFVIAGSLGLSGAAVLSGSGALRSGAGLVQVATPEPVALVVAAGNPCFMTAPLAADGHGRLARISLPLLLEQAAAASAVVLGPGLGQSDDVAAVVRTLVTEVTVPLLLDADALNVLGKHPDVLRQRQRPTVLTPHPGEFGRLIGRSTHDVQANRQPLAIAFARTFGIVLVLKGAGTIVTDGRQVFVNTTGNPGMATGGSGDVLSGVVGALLAQGMQAFAAAVLGVYVHGLAGDLARDARGETGLIATDVIEQLPTAFRRHAEKQTGG
jgi:ADP-dependent NAD(P)H-hydrate dehydratase